MSVLSERVMAVGRPEGPVSFSVWVPLLGAAWVAVNVLMVAAGTQVPYPLSCSFLAGIFNGTVLSVIAVAKASERFQAGATGLLGGLSLSGLRNDGSTIWKAVQGLHGVVDSVLTALAIPGTEKLHREIEQEILYVIWTTILVVLASLVAQWVRSARTEAAHIPQIVESPTDRS
ncbi:MAG TPA: hypothetical protein VMH04_02755 [Candidatus Solibacter sp.]|nr:hypothetical protein [Candidatus Solibacter sp.]